MGNPWSHLTMQRRFLSTCRELGLPEDASLRAWRDLELRYSEAHRHYHTLSHIAQMLSVMDAARRGSVMLELAIWYHDVIYDPHSSANEDRSAEYFVARLGYLLAQPLRDTVARLILATDHRRVRTGLADESLIIDLDLSIFGASDSEYDRYAAGIRKEYSFVSEDRYREGRSAILTRFLQHPIFTTPPFTSLEAPARSNLLRELGLLRPPDAPA